MTRRKIIIDTDPGQDDAFALLLALGSPDELEVVGVTSVHGNVPLARTTVNAQMVIELAGRADIPVYPGCPRPMVKPGFTAEYVHGPSGLDGCDLPPPSAPVGDKHGVDFIIDTVMAAAPGDITVCTLGPMTNLAVAMIKEPAIIPRLAEVVFMGGGFFEGGNTTPAAEFNIYVDPHAAHVVLASGAPVTMVPIDVTYKALMTPDWLRRLRAVGTRAAVEAAGMAEFYQDYGNKKFGTDSYPLHDPCVIGYLLRPDLFTGRKCHVEVEIHSPVTSGMTVVDWWNVTKKPANCLVLRDLDNPPFYELMLERIAQLR
ncbi:nucleoside hydrolase [Ancylobacter sp. Lp-2]|uniref:nucleoside hydrolase n=1 Tax=Ancylobacter sp. Lp-2 TaxID=2881339 RepID=UPI001E3869DE|nr:nucleoside hydrolase [Ancylobacter sp. Lp-2]MCB4768337.1 nucleoside hydrolase [Ancylobacter sp. Lp-2]